MPVNVQTPEGPVTHENGDQARWTEKGFLEVFAGDKTIAVHAPAAWSYFTVEKASDEINESSVHLDTVSIHHELRTLRDLANRLEGLVLSAELNDGTGV